MITRRDLLKMGCALGALGAGALHVAPADGAGAKRLLLVHGRSQQGLDPDTLKAEWMATLARGAAAQGLTVPGDVDVAFPFYGDKLDDYTRQYGIPLTSDTTARGTQLDDEFLVFQAALAEAIRERAGITDAQVDAEYGDNPQPRGPLNLKWVQAVLRAIDKNVPGMNQKTLEVFTRDVFLYTTRPGVRDEIDRIVASKLTEQPTVVIGHSLGSVVAYSVLSTDRRALQIPLFVTVGSPLAVRAIRDQFRPLRSPMTVAAWYNAFDPRDVVALYPLDARNFPVQPAIVNHGTVRNSTDNRHGITGYLDDREVAKRVLDSL
jgi:hypothetical protein